MSSLCRLRNKSHGEDGQWAYEEITKLREQVAAQASEIESLRISYDAACMLVAQMHEAAMGDVIGPYHGVVEDVRTKVAAQAAVIEALRAHLKVIAGLQLCADNLMSNSDIAAKALAIPTDSTQILDEVRREERERCAKVCESLFDHDDDSCDEAEKCAKAIRAME